VLLGYECSGDTYLWSLECPFGGFLLISLENRLQRLSRILGRLRFWDDHIKATTNAQAQVPLTETEGQRPKLKSACYMRVVTANAHAENIMKTASTKHTNVVGGNSIQ
jgi:hypothetical protein